MYRLALDRDGADPHTVGASCILANHASRIVQRCTIFAGCEWHTTRKPLIS